jgi:LysR family glycine cleavage system transcriptional activator
MKLPPMNALRAFEAVSRLGSVSKAAEEMCVSQGAVSQQLRNLEDHLGRELFVRAPNAMSLSDEGEAFAQVVQKTLREIADAAGDLSRSSERHGVTISVGPGMAIYGIMPRLAGFYRQHADINVVLDQSTGLVNFRNDGIDGAIRYCDGQFDDLDSAFLFHPRVYAMASPEYLQEHGELESLAHPDGHRLIDYQHQAKALRSQHVHWEDVVAGERIDPQIPVLTFPDEFQSMAAALQGRGIALVPRYLLEEQLESGQIRLACDEGVPGRFGYYFVWPSSARASPARDAFRDWLLESFRPYRDE